MGRARNLLPRNMANILHPIEPHMSWWNCHSQQLGLYHLLFRSIINNPKTFVDPSFVALKLMFHNVLPHNLAHRIHVCYIYIYLSIYGNIYHQSIYGNIYHQYTPNVSIYTSNMDPSWVVTFTPLPRCVGASAGRAGAELNGRPREQMAQLAFCLGPSNRMG